MDYWIILVFVVLNLEIMFEFCCNCMSSWKRWLSIAAAYLECSKCGFLAGSKKDLKQHSKFHKPGPELKLFCEHCSFVTDAKSRLDRHLMIHSKVRDRNFRWASRTAPAYSFIGTVSLCQVKPFSCPRCDYKASQKEHIKRHLRTRHGVEDTTLDESPAEKNPSQEIDQYSECVPLPLCPMICLPFFCLLPWVFLF